MRWLSRSPVNSDALLSGEVEIDRTVTADIAPEGGGSDACGGSTW